MKGKYIGPGGHVIQSPTGQDCPECGSSRTYWQFFFWNDPKEMGVSEFDCFYFLRENAQACRFHCYDCGASSNY